MIVVVDPASPVPVFEQLRAQIARHVAAGTLRPGDTLPPIRHLATDLGLARGTVAKVYEQLARDGVVRTAGRHGTIVAGPASDAAAGALSDAIDDAAAVDAAADELVAVVRSLSLDDSAAHAALTAALARRRPAGR